MLNKLLTQTDDTYRGLSGTIWADCPYLSPLDFSTVHGDHDDFASAFDASPTTVANHGKYEMFAESGGSFLGGVAKGGVQSLVSGTSADADVCMQLGGGASFVIDSTAPRKLWFEARVKISAVTADDNQQFIGLAEEDRTVATGVFGGSGSTTLATAMADFDYLGFVRLDGYTTRFDFVYNKAGQTDTTLIASVATVAADTYVKLGFKYDPDAPAAYRLKVFVDGVEKSTYGTNAILTASIFPDQQLMTPTFAVQTDSSTSATMSIDWWACYQLV